MAKHNGLTFAPVLIVDLRSVVRRNCRHVNLSPSLLPLRVNEFANDDLVRVESVDTQFIDFQSSYFCFAHRQLPDCQATDSQSTKRECSYGNCTKCRRA
jgi:hypothetical protein